MQVKEIKQDGLVFELEVTVPANDIDKHVDARLSEVGKTYRIPGFRPGKVPMKVLKQRLGKAVMGEVLEKAVNETSVKVFEEKKIRPAMQPKIEVKSFDEGKDLVYTVNVETLPEFKIADFKGLKLEKLVATPKDDQVKDALEKIAENNRGTAKVESDRKSKDGDTLLMDFAGRTADDNEAHPGMQGEGHKLKLGSGQFIPGFEEKLIGYKAGEKVEVKVTFPEQYHADLAGRDAIFDVTIHEIHEDAESKVDDELAKNLGMEDLKALKKIISEQLSAEFDQTARMLLKKKLLDFLDEEHKFDIPPTMLNMEHENILQQLEMERKSDPEAAELTDAEKEEYKDIAERRVRLGLILSEIGHKNNISVADSELQRAVITEAQKYPGQERAVFDYYAKNRQALESLRAPLFEEKVVDFILELAEIKETEATPDEIMAALEADEDMTDKPKEKKKATSKAKKEDKSSDEAPKKKAAAKKDEKSAEKKKSTSKAKKS